MAEVVTLAEPVDGVVQVEAEFTVYDVGLAVDDSIVQSVKSGARLRSVNQRAADSDFDDIQALLATMLLNEDLGSDRLIRGPTMEPDIGTWYIARLSGWISTESVQPSTEPGED